MSLHKTVALIKKVSLGIAIGLGATITLVIIVRVGIFMKNIIFPPRIDPPNYSYGILPAIQFPMNPAGKNFTYTLNTLSGTLPDFPDRLNVYPIIQPQPNLLNLEKARTKAAALGFTQPDGTSIQEIPLGNSFYEWDLQDAQTAITKKLTFNTVNFNFKLISDYMASLTVIQALALSDQKSALLTAQSVLNSISLLPSDVDITKTNNPSPTVHYVTYPQLFSIQNDTLIPATSLSKAQVIRVDFYQKDLSYSLNTGVQGDNHIMKQLKMQLPIVYPDPPNSTMSFWVASGPSSAQIVQANFFHQNIDTSSDTTNTAATYSIKTPQDAFNELKNGGGYIASFDQTKSTVLINNVYLAYYLGEIPQQYLMPIIVFEGDNGFIAYISAIKNEWTK